MSGTLFGDDPVPATPSTDWITAHCDGGSRGNPGPAGYGVSITSSDGQVLAELSEFLGVCSNNVAEYRGLLASLDWAIAHQYSRLRVISDSLLMVNQVKGRYKVNSPDLRPLWDDARSKIRHFDGFDISHALRHKNKDADRLANEAMDRGTGRPAAGPPPSRAAAVNSPVSRPVPAPQPASKPMLRGFVRDGGVQILGNNPLPDGVFVKVIPE
jgi:probable phosphoglycerate mutase